MIVYRVEIFTLLLSIVGFILNLLLLIKAPIKIGKKIFFVSTLLITVIFFGFAIFRPHALPKIELLTFDNRPNIDAQYWDSSWAGAFESKGGDKVYADEGIKVGEQLQYDNTMTSHGWVSIPKDKDNCRYASRVPVSDDHWGTSPKGSSIKLKWEEYPPSEPGYTWQATIIGLGNGYPGNESNPPIYMTYDLTNYDCLEFYIKGHVDKGNLLVRLGDDNKFEDTYAPNNTNPLPVNSYIIGGSIAENVWGKVVIPLSDYKFEKNAYHLNNNPPDIKKIKQVSFSSTEGSGEVLVSSIVFTGSINILGL